MNTFKRLAGKKTFYVSFSNAMNIYRKEFQKMKKGDKR